MSSISIFFFVIAFLFLISIIIGIVRFIHLTNDRKEQNRKYRSKEDGR